MSIKSSNFEKSLKVLGGKEAILKRNFYSMEDGQGSEIEGIRALNAGVFVDVFENRVMYVATLFNIVLLL